MDLHKKQSYTNKKGTASAMPFNNVQNASSDEVRQMGVIWNK
jgi:hypothetical protein